MKINKQYPHDILIKKSTMSHFLFNKKQNSNNYVHLKTNPYCSIYF